MREQGGERKARKNTSLEGEEERGRQGRTREGESLEGEEERGRRGRSSVVLVNLNQN